MPDMESDRFGFHKKTTISYDHGKGSSVIFSTDYQGLDPYGELPFETRRISLDVKKMIWTVDLAMDASGAGGTTSGYEIFNYSIHSRSRGKDFENRPVALLIQGGFNVPETQWPQIRQIQHRYHLYKNGAGIFQQVDNFYIDGFTLLETIMTERFINIEDLQTIKGILRLNSDLKNII